jgi:hypothetical protein
MSDAEKLARAIADYDFEHGDLLCLKFGGDGDNGEALIEALAHVLANRESPLTAPDMVDRETFKTVITCWTNDRELLHAFMDLSTFEEIKRAQEYREQVRRGSLQPDVDATRVTLTTSDESGEGAE